MLSVIVMYLFLYTTDKDFVLSNSYHVHKAQIKTVTSTINMIKIYDIVYIIIIIYILSQIIFIMLIVEATVFYLSFI